VTLGARSDSVLLSIRDDGSGFPARDEGAPRGHYGLIGMRERAESIGADFRLSSRPGVGTIVSVAVPISKEQRSVVPGVAHGD
jgi:signal transduction histidine kinase